MLEFVKINDVTSELWNGRNDFGIELQIMLDNEVIFNYDMTGEEFVKQIILNYNSYSYYFISEFYAQLPELNRKYFAFRDLFTRWKQNSEHSLKRMILAMVTNYKPLENFDRLEDITVSVEYKGKEKNKESFTGAKGYTHEYEDLAGSKVEFTPTGTKLEETQYDSGTTYSGKETTTDSTSAYNDTDANTWRNKDKSQKDFTNRSDTKTGMDTTSYMYHQYKESTDEKRHNRFTVSEFYNDGEGNSFERTDSKEFENRKDSTDTTSHLHGNIGVTKSQEMLFDELKLRMRFNITNLIIRNFACDNLILL